jgi:hypothetical protein
MVYTFESKTELRRHLQNKRIRRVDFGATGLLNDERAIVLHLEGPETIRIEATPYGTLKIEAI